LFQPEWDCTCEQARTGDGRTTQRLQGSRSFNLCTFVLICSSSPVKTILSAELLRLPDSCFENCEGLC